MKLSLSTGLAAGILALVSAPALAAPVTVDLRIEGPTATVFEGPVTTDVRTFPSNQGAKRCDAGASRVTSGAVLAAASEGAPFAFKADWNDQYESATFTEVGGENVNYDPATGRYLGEFLNGKGADLGACSQPVQAGNQVLFAYAAYGEPLLALSGPASAKPGESVTVKVTDGNGAPVAGATVRNSQTGADGTATIGPLNSRGELDLKATKPNAVRSNRLRVCVSDGADGLCGTRVPSTPGAQNTTVAAPDRTAPRATLAGFTDHQAFKTGPRELKGSFVDTSGVKVVKLRLTKRLGGDCWYFSGKQERFRHSKCGTGAYFAIGQSADWSYLLPSRLGKGRYVLDAVAIDGAGNRTPLARGTTRVVFTVR
jgi:hypothetical protein